MRNRSEKSITSLSFENFEGLITINLLKSFRFVEVFTSNKTQTNRSNRWKPVDISKYTVFLNYAAQKKPTSDVLKLIDELIDADRINPDDADQLKREIGSFINTLNPKELRFYNAYESLSGSLTDNLQVSIAGPDDDEILVLKTTARDYLFRNLRFKNVLVNLDSDKTKFVFPVTIYLPVRTYYLTFVIFSMCFIRSTTRNSQHDRLFDS